MCRQIYRQIDESQGAAVFNRRPNQTGALESAYVFSAKGARLILVWGSALGNRAMPKTQR